MVGWGLLKSVLLRAPAGPKAAKRSSAGVTKTVSARGRAPKPRRFYSGGASSDDDASDSGNRRRKHHNPWCVPHASAWHSVAAG